MKNRSLVIFGVLAGVLAVGLFFLLASTTTWAWYWNWLIAAGSVTFVYFGYDKLSAKAGAGRIPELLLYLLSLGGGFAGALLGMLAFRHKTNFRAHPLFYPAVVMGAGLWAVLIYWLLSRA